MTIYKYDWTELATRLIDDYSERWDGDDDLMHPETYAEYIQGMSKGELLERYNDDYGTEIDEKEVCD